MSEPRKRRRAPRRAELGLSLDEYELLLELQDGGCGICGRPAKTRRLDVDHDHKTHEIRGLLCHRHNRGLGYFASVDELLFGIAYLRRAAELRAALERHRELEREHDAE